jgi:hypothetical protein
MSYLNAIFYLDYGLGIDTARSTLLNVVFSNPAGDTVLGTYVGHGLITGAVITVSGCTQAYANTAWKITRLDNDTFTLDTASWALFNGADVTGDVVPFGGQSWADAWKTIKSGATSARIAPGDIVRIAKSPAPSSIGNATWTNLSKTVTLAGAQNVNIDMCETAWTPNGAGDTTVTLTGVATDAKEGSNCMQLTLDASPQANIMQAFFATGTLDLSGYQRITFWIKNSYAILSTHWVVKLCTDVAGATPVDLFVIPAIPSNSQWVPVTITKTGGGNLNAAIKSIAIYTGSVAPTASSNILVDDFVACTTDGLNLQSLISKNSLEQGGAEGWYGIQSINGVIILLDNGTNTKANAGKGYSTSGTSPETVPTYKRETTKTDMTASLGAGVSDIQDSGTVGNNIQFQGGYNTSNNNQDGETFLDGLNGFGYGIYLYQKSYVTINYLNIHRYYRGFVDNGSNSYITVTNLSNVCNNTNYSILLMSLLSGNTITNLRNSNNNSSYGIIFSSGYNYVITNIGNICNNLSQGIYFSVSINNFFGTILNANNNSSAGIYFNSSPNNIIGSVSHCNSNGMYGVTFVSSFNNIIRTLSTSGNGAAGIYNESGYNYIGHLIIAEATKIVAMPEYGNFQIFVTGYNSDPLDNRIYTDTGNIISEVTTRHTEAGMAWQLNPTNTKRDSSYPLRLSVAKIAVVANKAVTVKAWMKLSNISDILGALVVRGGQLAGVSNDVITNASTADQDWHEVILADFTPTEDGVIEVECWAWWVANLADESAYIDDMTISQAA